MNEEVEITLLQDEVSVETPLVADYILPTATSSTLGGVKIGDNIDIDSTGHISIPVASQSSLGVVQAGTGINIDANGVISTDAGEYTLPEATKTILGGVYVDDELSTSSTHPVQNAVVSLAINEIEGDVNTLSTNVNNLSSDVNNLSTSVTNLSTTVGNLSGTVTNQGNDISTIQGNINTINGNITDINEDLTNTGNALTTLQGTVDPLVVNYDETINGTAIDNTIWTNGDVRIYRRGRTGVIYVNLEGSLTIADGTSEIIHTIADSDNFPTIESIGLLSSDAGWLETVVNTDGEIVLYNNSGSSITLTELKGNIPVVWL